MQQGKVLSVSKCPNYAFSKNTESALCLIKGEGVEGDVHRGITVKHRSRIKKDPTQKNLRQVHLIHNELIKELKAQGFDVAPGVMGENITTEGIDLMSLPRGTQLKLGSATIEVTGLRNPCGQLDEYQKGLTKAVLGRDEDGNLVRKAGVMAVVVEGGMVTIDDLISVELPAKPYQPLEPV